MSEYIHDDGTIRTASEIKAANPNTSFPPVLTTDILKSLGYSPILFSEPPTPSSSTKIVVRDGAEKNYSGEWIQKWVEKDRFEDIEDGKTKAEQDAEYQASLDANQLEAIRNERYHLLQEADWQIHKIEDASGDSSAWRTYRQALRDITKASDIYNVTWPSKPE